MAPPGNERRTSAFGVRLSLDDLKPDGEAEDTASEAPIETDRSAASAASSVAAKPDDSIQVHVFASDNTLAPTQELSEGEARTRLAQMSQLKHAVAEASHLHGIVHVVVTSLSNLSSQSKVDASRPADTALENPFHHFPSLVMLGFGKMKRSNAEGKVEVVKWSRLVYSHVLRFILQSFFCVFPISDLLTSRAKILIRRTRRPILLHPVQVL